MPTAKDLFALPHEPKRVLGFIESYWIEHGYSPTYREIASALDLNVGAVRRYCGILEKADFVKVIQKNRGKESRERRVCIPNIPGRDYWYQTRQLRRRVLLGHGAVGNHLSN